MYSTISLSTNEQASPCTQGRVCVCPVQSRHVSPHQHRADTIQPLSAGLVNRIGRACSNARPEVAVRWQESVLQQPPGVNNVMG